MRLAALVALVAVVACVDPLTTRPVSSPEFATKNIAGYAETAMGPPPDVAYAWDLDFVGDVARWRECSTADACTNVERSRPASDLLAVAPAGRAHVGDGPEVDVVKLSLAPGRKYVVPTRRIR
jgi:hypothetical protein